LPPSAVCGRLNGWRSRISSLVSAKAGTAGKTE
jgi:hypothetical protein